MNNLEFSNFLSNAPLYSKSIIKDVELLTPMSFDGAAFDFYCTNEEAIKTFVINVWPDLLSLQYSVSNYTEAVNRLLDSENKFHFIQQYRGVCQSCKCYELDFLLLIKGLRSIADEENRYELKPMDIVITKVGSYPAFEISPNQETFNFLSSEDRTYYKKGLICLSQSYGIGAFAYFRRIIENEILKILKEIGELPLISSPRIKELIAKYEVDHQTATLVDNVYQFLPDSLKSIGDNPIKLLYSQLSDGIHSLSEEICLSKAVSINELLIFVISKISEERTTKVKLKGLLDQLRNQ